MPSRDELIAIVDVTPTTIRAGLGVHELIRGPLVFLSTKVARRKAAAAEGNSAATTAVEDYVVSADVAQLERRAKEQDLDLVDTFVPTADGGLDVADWVAFEAILRHALHTSLGIQRPPLSHPTIMSVPVGFSPSTLDMVHLMMFERVLVPQLIVTPRPMLAAIASGVSSAIVIDLGSRGAGASTISCVHENSHVARVDAAFNGVDEGVLDDYAAVCILEESAELRERLLGGSATTSMNGASSQGAEEDDQAKTARWAMDAILAELKDRGEIAFESEIYDHIGDFHARRKRAAAASAAGFDSDGGVNMADSAGATVVDSGDDETGGFDVARLLAEGRMDEIVRRKRAGENGASGEEDEEAQRLMDEQDARVGIVRVANPLERANVDGATQLRIGLARHRYLEPLFAPQVLDRLASSDVARRLGIQLPAHRETAGLHELVPYAVGLLDDFTQRAAVWENVCVIANGKAGKLKSLPATMLSLLSTNIVDAESGSEFQPRYMRHARTPDYFSEFKERGGEWATYLGACIMSKLAFADTTSHLFVSKTDYSTHGPGYWRLLDVI